MKAINIKNGLIWILFISSIFVPLSLAAQYKISGNVVNSQNSPLRGALVELQEEEMSSYTNEEGLFNFEGLQEGNYTLSISFIGYETLDTNITLAGKNTSYDQVFILRTDPLELSSIIVTGSFNAQSKLESSIAISTLSDQEIQMRAAKGTADLLSAIPGTFADASTGEVFTKVYSRGISISAEDDLGWYYVSLQEDGLPVSATQHTFYSPDLFHRADLTTKRLEAIRGGSASITSNNAPGGIFNFISKTGGNIPKGEVLLSTALQGDGRGLYRIDGNFGGPLFNNGWRYNIGGFYRYDEGAREVDFNWSEGGQLKFNAVKATKSGFFKFYAKYLNDKVNRWTGLSAVDWDAPKAAFGQDFNNTALMLPELNTNIADGRSAATNPEATFNYNPDNGIRTKDMALGFEFSQFLGAGWTIRNNLKFSTKEADWQTSIGNQPLGLEEFTPYVLNGISSDFSVIPLGQIVFRDARNKEVLAKVNNLGILGPFSGEPASFEYLEGSLPNDALMGIAPWKKEDEATEIIDQLSLQKQLGDHSLTIGSYLAYSDIGTFTSGSFAYATFEPQPRMLSVSLENPGEPVIHLSDQAGVSNYGGLFYGRAEAEVLQSALFLNDFWKITEKLNFDGGIRYEFINHQGQKDRSAPTANDLDDQMETAYNNSTLVATGEVDAFDFNYDYLSWSLGLNYTFNKNTALFGRFTNGHKAPELNYYFNNFQNLPVPEAGTTQDVLQAEIGYKWYTEKITFFTTAFWSRLDNVSFSEFIFDQNTGELFFTPAQLNQTTTFGLELESIVTLFPRMQVHLLATLQEPEATQFTVYNGNGTADESDDVINDYSGNELPHNPKVALEISPMYQADKWRAFFSWRYLSDRQANIANAFQLPAFSVFNAGIIVEPNKNWSISLIANNLFNSKGLMNFFGPNEFGSSANAATPEYIAQNPEASFVVFPIVPRTINLGIGYRF